MVKIKWDLFSGHGVYRREPNLASSSECVFTDPQWLLELVDQMPVNGVLCSLLNVYILTILKIHHYDI